MSPTLVGGVGGRCHYGISDNHRNVINKIDRFDVVITYYPSSWTHSDEDTTYKIKRVWGFPGESLTMSYSDETYIFTVSKNDNVIYTVSGEVSQKNFDIYGDYWVATFKTEKRTFNTHVASNSDPSIKQRTSFTIHLSEEKKEYFLMGDNWLSSSDSYQHLGSGDRITYENLQGRVVAIKGTAVVVNGELTDKREISNMFYF